MLASACIVHDEFKTQALTRLQEEYPDATTGASRICKLFVDMADAVGSTSQLIAAAKRHISDLSWQPIRGIF